jgi:hypothetical protein
MLAGQLCGGLRAAGRDVGQWLPIGHRGQHTQGDDQTTEYTTHCSQQCHRYKPPNIPVLRRYCRQ